MPIRHGASWIGGMRETCERPRACFKFAAGKEQSPRQTLAVQALRDARSPRRLRMDEARPPTVSDRSAATAAGDARALLQVAGLTKRWRDDIALADVAFDVHPGEILGLIGPN